MISALQKQPNGTIELTVTIPYETVKKTWDEVLDSLVKAAEFPGFRKGMTPKKMVEEKTDKTKLRQDVLKNLLPQYYIYAIKKQKINPIMSPKIHVNKVEDPTSNKKDDWRFTALTCETPKIELNNYKDNIKKITAKSKIIIPGKEPLDPTQNKKTDVKFEDLAKAILDAVKIEIPEILLQSEADRFLAQTLDDVKKLGLTLDQYLTSTGRTSESLRQEYTQKAKNDIALEFALQKIADTEKIKVDEKEIEETIQKTKDPNERKNLQNNRYLLANIIRQQKTLDFLKNL